MFQSRRTSSTEFFPKTGYSTPHLLRGIEIIIPSSVVFRFGDEENSLSHSLSRLWIAVSSSWSSVLAKKKKKNWPRRPLVTLHSLSRPSARWIVTGQFLKTDILSGGLPHAISWHVLFFFHTFFDTWLEEIFVEVNLGDVWSMRISNRRFQVIPLIFRKKISVLIFKIRRREMIPSNRRNFR